MNSMRLLVCTSEYPPDYSSGIGNVAFYVVEELKKMGTECTVCSPKGPDIKLGSSKMIDKFGILGLLYYWYKVSKYFKENNFDVVWLHNPLFLKKNPFKKYLVTMHSTYHGFLLKGFKPEIYYRIASKLEKRFLNMLQEKYRFTGVSNEVCNELTEIGISKQKITYIPNGVDTKLFKPSASDDKKSLRKKFGIPEEDLIILSLGRLTEAKQPQKLIEVFSLIEKEINDVTLVIAGKGELLEKTKEFAKQKGLKNVLFLGYVDHKKEAPDLYACSDYYIMASKYEGQPLTLLEAMASGLPCIVSDIPNLRFIEGAKSGIVVNFNDEEKAAKKIIEYLKRGNSEHSENARRYAVNNLDWEIIAEGYLEEFKRCYGAHFIT